jgi:hypothetical protein
MALKPPPMSRLKQYGLATLDWLKQMAYQHDRCAICKKTFTKKRTPNNDHRHSDGFYRGLLCEGCNTMLGILHDNKEWCLNAFHYLDSPPSERALDGPRYAKDAPPHRGSNKPLAERFAEPDVLGMYYDGCES